MHSPSLPQRLIARTVVGLIRLLSSSLRYEYIGPRRPEEPFIACLWHNRLALGLPIYHRFLTGPAHGLAALVSASRDGALLTGILSGYGIRAVRGSSSRRGSGAFRELVGLAREGWDLAITPDGPRGPRYRISEPGIVKLAQLTGRPIVPLSYSLAAKWTAGSWDRFQIPRPFTTCRLRTAPPLHVPRTLDARDLGAWCRRLENTMHDITID